MVATWATLSAKSTVLVWEQQGFQQHWAGSALQQQDSGLSWFSIKTECWNLSRESKVQCLENSCFSQAREISVSHQEEPPKATGLRSGARAHVADLLLREESGVVSSACRVKEGSEHINNSGIKISWQCKQA